MKACVIKKHEVGRINDFGFFDQFREAFDDCVRTVLCENGDLIIYPDTTLPEEDRHNFIDYLDRNGYEIIDVDADDISPSIRVGENVHSIFERQFAVLSPDTPICQLVSLQQLHGNRLDIFPITVHIAGEVIPEYGIAVTPTKDWYGIPAELFSELMLSLGAIELRIDPRRL